MLYLRRIFEKKHEIKNINQEIFPLFRSLVTATQQWQTATHSAYIAAATTPPGGALGLQKTIFQK